MRLGDVVLRVKNVKRNGSGFVACCPAHEDRKASLSLSEGDDGRVLLHCHAGCPTEAVVAALGLQARDLFPEGDRPHGALRREVAHYSYTDEYDREIYQVVRFEPKDFRQRRRDGAGGWVWNLNGVQRVLYRLPRVLEAARKHDVIFVAEGEKDVLKLEELGLVATTNAGGAGRWTARHAEALKGARGIYVIADNDPPGRKHAEEVARSVHERGIPIKVVSLPGVPEKGDVSDWIAQGHTKDELLKLAQAAPLWEAPAVAETPEVELVQETTSVLVRLDTVKPEKVSWLWPGRIPFGKLTVIDGDPGKSKSTLTLDIAARVTMGHSLPGETMGREPAGVVVMTAEDGLADTVRPRLEAARGDPSKVVALDGVRLPSGACRMPTMADIENIREAIKAVGAKLLIIDPVMAYLGSKDSHKDQDIRSIAHPVAHLAEETGVAVILVRHLNKSEKASPIYRGGGSIGIAGAARSVLLVAPDREDPELRVLAPIKWNLSAMPPSLSYRLIPERDVVRIKWEGPVEVTAAALLAAHGSEEEAGGLRGAESFLVEILGSGPVPSRDVFAQARQAGIADRTLKRAKAALGIKAYKSGGTFGGDPTWYWEMRVAPEEGQHGLKGATGTLGPLQGDLAPFSTDPDLEVLP